MQETQTPETATSLTGKRFTVHLLNETSGGEQVEVLDALPALGLLRLRFLGRPTTNVAWVPLAQITSLYDTDAPAEGPFAAAAEIDFGVPNSGLENTGTANGPAAVGETRYFKFRVTAPGFVGLFLGHSSSGFDAGPITLYAANYSPLPSGVASSGFRGPLAVGLYYVSFTVTETQAGNYPGTNEYQFQIVGNSPIVSSPPGPLASLARADAPPPA